MYTTVDNNSLDINDNSSRVGFEAEANKASLFSYGDGKALYLKSGDREIKILDGNGVSYFDKLYVNGRDISKDLEVVNSIKGVLKEAKWTQTFYLGTDGGHIGKNNYNRGDTGERLSPQRLSTPFDNISYKITTYGGQNVKSYTLYNGDGSFLMNQNSSGEVIATLRGALYVKIDSGESTTPWNSAYEGSAQLSVMLTLDI